MSGFSIRNPYLMVVLCLVIMIMGTVSVTEMPVDMFPPVNLPVVAVATFYSGMPPQQIEENLTYHLERQFTLASGIDHMESRSLPGVSLIKVYFRAGTDPDADAATISSLASSDLRDMPPENRVTLRKQRRETFERIMANIPAKLHGDDLRFLLRALVWSGGYGIFDEPASFYASQSEERNEQDYAEVLDGVITKSTSEQLPSVLARLALTDHIDIPREGLIDFLTLAAERFLPKEESVARKPISKAPAKKATAKKASS